MQPQVTVVPCLTDNYAYLVRAPGEQEAWVVDPSEAEPVLRALSAEGLRLAGILCTHHHYDHVGGNEELCAKFPGLTVVGSAHDRDRIPGLTRTVEDEEVWQAGSLEVRVLAVPGHTLGAVAFVIGDAVFTGDTLFVAGCGRLFEGTAAMMHRSLSERLGALPGATRVYCGHEYSAQNAKFAHAIEPENAAVSALLASAEAAVAAGRPTVPSRIDAELLHNPFMRVHLETVAAQFGASDPVSVFASVRAKKDAF